VSEEQGEAVRDGEEQMQPLRTMVPWRVVRRGRGPQGGRRGVCGGGAVRVPQMVTNSETQSSAFHPASDR
jgi:hypothetical protein